MERCGAEPTDSLRVRDKARCARSQFRHRPLRNRQHKKISRQLKSKTNKWASLKVVQES